MTDDKDDIVKLVHQVEGLLKRIKYLLERESAGFPEKLETLVKKRICLGCGKKMPKESRVFRGNHESCYRRVYRKIQDGKISDGEAVDVGLLTPASPGGKPRISTHLDEYLAVREQESAEYAVTKRPKRTKTRKRKSKKGRS